MKSVESGRRLRAGSNGLLPPGGFRGTDSPPALPLASIAWAHPGSRARPRGIFRLLAQRQGEAGIVARGTSADQAASGTSPRPTLGGVASALEELLLEREARGWSRALRPRQPAARASSGWPAWGCGPTTPVQTAPATVLADLRLPPCVHLNLSQLCVDRKPGAAEARRLRNGGGRLGPWRGGRRA